MPGATFLGGGGWVQQHILYCTLLVTDRRQMGNPRRDALEYGVLIALGSSMAVAYGLLIAYTQQREPDGQRRRLPRVDLDASVDLREAWNELRDFGGGVVRGGGTRTEHQQQRRQDDGSADVAKSRDRGGGGVRPPP